MAKQQPQKRFLKGLFKDTAHIDQPEGTWRYARNTILNEKKGSIANENGNEFSTRIPLLDVVLGIVEVTNDKAIIFYLDSSGNSAVGKWEADVFQRVYNPNVTLHGDKVDLKFNQSNPIEGTFNINPKGELLVYWTDDLNPPRVINVTLQLEGNPARIYNINPATSHANHIDLLILFPNSGPVPHVDLLEISLLGDTLQLSTKEGGGLLTGVYYLSLAYVDDSYTATNFLTMANPVSIVDEGDHTRPTTKKDGAPEATQTSKSITWQVTNLNNDYKFIRPVVIRKMGAAVDAYRLNDMDILAASTIEVVFSGIEGFTKTSLEDVIIDTISYETAKTINQLDGVLYVGNTTGVEDLGYQKYANNIKLNAVTKTFEDFDINVLTVDNLETGFNFYPVDQMGVTGSEIDVEVDHSKSYRYTPNIFKYKGYMRDEVYAFYIAFIMNDGSMSYAYHIPGRKSMQQSGSIGDLLPLEDEGWFKEFKNLNPTIIKKFHLHDFSDIAIGANLITGTLLSRNMNYWENATEKYPNTDNFEVWNGITQLGNIKNTFIRHHHFPSNGNPDYKTIHTNFSGGLKNNTEVVLSKGVDFGVEAWDSDDGTSGTQNFIINYNDPAFSSGSGGSSGTHNLGCDVWKTVRYGPGVLGTDIIYTTPTAPVAFPNIHDALWKNQKYFVADQPMEVRVEWNTWISCDGNEKHYGQVQLIKETTGGTLSIVNQQVFTLNDGSIGSQENVSRLFIDCPVQTLEMGDRLYLRVMQTTDEPNGGPGTSECGYWVRMQGLQGGNIAFEVYTGQAMIGPYDLHDVKLSHNVKALGFELEDIKIPESIADKVQGFRIYRAKRKHEDKRILGQGVVTPMVPEHTVLGQCEESFTNIDAQQIMSSALSLRELIYSKSPYAVSRYLFPTYPIIYSWRPGSGWFSGGLKDKRAYKSFSFNDFNLLRTQNTLAGATHIKPEYLVQNFAWNGPTNNQPKKMLSKIVLDSGEDLSEPIKKIEQFWGWDTSFNCHSKETVSAIFAGCWYKSSNSLAYNDITTNEIRDRSAAPRLIGQKAISYIPGDSIFQASSLGFGGKIANEFGESSIIFSLQDRHEFYTNDLVSNRAGTTGGSGLSTGMSTYAQYHMMTPSILVNPQLIDADPYTNYAMAHAYYENKRRSQQMMVNLHAFKTDMYKSIDNQELVWTGFEVLGENLENFIFDKDGTPGGDFKTKSIHPDGIFGGDTYICRYGYRSSINHNNVDTDSKPVRVINYQIVESVDNINFRHSENDSDLYFPGSIAKRILSADGDKDFTHQDNLNYDDSFSAENDLRPAFPLPLTEIEQTEFPTRAHRSAKRDTTSLTDNYRIFLANQFKDLPKNRGELWKLSTFNNLLYFHMEESLYVTKGKQQMQMKDGSEAFVGSGDIFAQEPDEILQADKGYGGTQSQWAALTCPQGYFFVDVNSRKVFLMKDKLIDIGLAGLENWFKDNLPFALESFGYNTPCVSEIFDNPLIGLGLTSVYDPKFKRVILTKKDLVPTEAFITGYQKYIDYIASNTAAPWNGGEIYYRCDLGHYVKVTVDDMGSAPPGTPQTYTYNILAWDEYIWFTKADWTISYYPEFNMWCGFHDYTPYIYFNTSDNFYSIPDSSSVIVSVSPSVAIGDIYRHDSDTKGTFYNILYPFEIEYIHNEYREEDTLLSSFNYTLETFNTNNISVLEHGFTSFFIYNTMQISNKRKLEYLLNTRRVGNSWKVHNFRDMAALVDQTGVAGVNTSAYYTTAGTNIIGGINTGTVTTSSTESMFTVAGMSEILNTSYIDAAKTWNTQRKFTDKWIGIRLICDNSQNNLLNLYTAAAVVRKTYK